MARRVRGRPVHGWLILDKPAGPTSTAAVTLVRRALDARKAGHAGTLDPAATGLLAVALGEATKTVPHAGDGLKTYRFTVRWGAATTSDDAEGAVIATSEARPTPEAITAALPAFRGDILQVPPQVSAVKVEGARAYDLARAGEVMDLAARQLHVARLELVEVPGPDTAVLEMECGKGGYVRSIARDLGAALGCLGHVQSLRRLAAGPFALGAAVPWEAVAAGDLVVRGSRVFVGTSFGLHVLDKSNGSAVVSHLDGSGFGLALVGSEVVYRPVITNQPLKPFRRIDAATGAINGDLVIPEASRILGTINGNMFGIGSPTDDYRNMKGYEFATGLSGGSLAGMRLVVRQIGENGILGYPAETTL